MEDSVINCCDDLCRSAIKDAAGVFHSLEMLSLSCSQCVFIIYNEEEAEFFSLSKTDNMRNN